MAAAMPRGAARNRLAAAGDLLRKLRQGVVLRENPDDWRARPVFRDKSGRHAGHAFLDAKAGLLEHADEPGRGAMFLQADLGEGPDVLINLDQLITQGIEVLDDVIVDRGCRRLICSVLVWGEG